MPNSKPARKTSSASKMSARGHAADAKGLRFELEVSNYYAKQGWELEGRHKFEGFEIDLLGKKEVVGGKDCLIVECKDKANVTAAEVLRFMRKASAYRQSMPALFGLRDQLDAIIAHTGTVSKDAVEAAKTHDPPIVFRHFSR